MSHVVSWKHFDRPEPKHSRWFKKEQGRFLRKARIHAGLSVRDVARKTGVDVRWIESGEVNLQARNLIYFVRLYRIPEDYFLTWDQFVALKIRQIGSDRVRH